ncbi:hypothetical protein [Neolewinella antarctica]|uniref:Phage anti-repressor protein n=1 Tax=Neolewinella antarctica TaxID=442734 RepID=A0ABX0XAS0_9BACT|nr:hypothetical protein [Neolewinella antarctica]NJC26335.1 phage anti-repressor protein [Neolewinella antarctica]
MDLKILTSKRGTRVVKATQLHRALGLNDNHYQVNVQQWLKDVYEFTNGIRRPEGLKDYARSAKTKGQLMQEYYLQVEFAKLVALGTKSKVKQAVATKLSKEEQIYPEHVKLSTDEMLTLLEQTKAMARISCQKGAEQRHLAHYSHRRGSGDYWQHFRHEQIVFLKMEDIRAALKEKGVKSKATAELRDLLLRFDPLETIRIGIVDHYAALGSSMPYAQEMGQLAKTLATELRLEVVDDRKGDLLFAPAADSELVRKLQIAA